MKTLYALIVAIDKYPIPAHQLNGCVNDATSFSDYLKSFCDSHQIIFNEKRLFDDAAKRLEVVNGFKHFDAATDDDICVYYYSGHGSQMKAPLEFTDEPDGLSETIVCWDSRLQQTGSRDMADKELNYLIHKAVEGKNAHFLAVMDCCHSGSNTRDLAIKSRMVDACPTAPRGVSDYIGFAEYIDFQPPAAQHVHLAAAKDDETAKEYAINGTPRGVFTYSLIEALQQAGGNISYSELMSRVNLKCRNRVKEQTPLLNVYVDNEAAKLSFLGQVEIKRGTFIVSYDNTEGWIVNVGGAQGIPASGATLTLENGMTVATAKVLSNFSKLTGLDLLAKDQQLTATLTEVNFPPVRVAFSSDSEKEGVSAVAKALDESSENLQLVDSEVDTDYVIRVWDGALRLTTVDSTTPLFRRVKGYDEQAARTFVNRMGAVADWRNRLELANPNTSIGDNAVEITFYDGTGTVVNDRVFRQPNEGMSAYMRVSIKNMWTKPLWVSAVYFGSDFTISNQFLRKKFINSGETAWIEYKNERNIPLNVPPEFLSWDINEIEEYFKIFVSTDEIDTDVHNQEGLPLDERSGAKRAIGGLQTASMDDWRTFERDFHVVCPLTAVLVSAEKDVAPKLGNITITAPDGFSAKANLSSTQEAKRDLSDQKILRGGKNMSAAALSESFGSSPTMDVLELHDIEGDISMDNPLKINLSGIQEDEVVLALGYDAETGLYFPLGISDTEGALHIHHLPAEQATTRGLGGSVKMFFRKLIKPITGKFEYPMLRFVQLDPSSDTDHYEYVDDTALIKSKVTDPSVQNIAVFVHGWVGSTMDKVSSTRRPTRDGQRSMGETYDMILAFDYESLNTSIEETAADLQRKLEEVGLKKGCGKHFTIIAHSMGGLVSRYFVEALKGKEFVNHLIMFGTASNGSEIADLRTTIAHWLTLGLNGATFLQPYLLPISWLGKLIDKASVTLKEHSPTSPFIQNLNKLPDAQVPYHIVIGNTALLHEKQPEIAGLIQKIRHVLQKRDKAEIVDMFLGKSNDIVVTIESTSRPGLQSNFTVLEVASTHFTYFEPLSDGLEAFATASRAVL